MRLHKIMEEEISELSPKPIVKEEIQKGLVFLKGFFADQGLVDAASAVDQYEIRWYQNQEALRAVIEPELSRQGRKLPPGAQGTVINNVFHCSVEAVTPPQRPFPPYIKEIAGIHEPTNVVIHSQRKEAGVSEALDVPLVNEGVAFYLGAKEAQVNPLSQAKQFIRSGGNLPAPDDQYFLKYHPEKGLYYFDPIEKQRCLVAERTHQGYLVVVSFFDLMVQKFGFPRCWQLCLTTNKERFQKDFSAILGVPFAEIVEEWKTTVSPPELNPS